MPPKIDKILPLICNNWRAAAAKRKYLQHTLLGLAGFSSMKEFLEYISSKTCVIFFHAGVGSRWKNSLTLKRNILLMEKFNVDRQKPRALVKIINFLPGVVGEYIALGAYNVYAVARTTDNMIVVHADGEKDDIHNEIIKPLKLEKITSYFTQKIYPGYNKPLGHADSLIQLFKSDKISRILDAKKYIVTCFGGPPNRRSTVELTLLTLYALDKYGEKVSWLSPTAVLKKPIYPIRMDKNGKILGLGHQKLFGKNSLQDLKDLPNNVGIHVFKITQVKSIVNSLQKFPPRSKSGELALDHIMMRLIKKNQVAILNTADKKEIRHDVKSIEAIPGFIRDMRDLFIYDTEPKKIYPQEVAAHQKHIAKILREKPHNIVFLDPNPLTEGCGIGHSRQIYMMQIFLSACGLSHLVTYISLSHAKESGILTKLAFKYYRDLQGKPLLYNLVHKMLDFLGNRAIIDKQLLSTDMSDEVVDKLYKQPNFNPKLPTIFITTLVTETITAINLIKKHHINGAVLDYIPDPYPLVQLQMMSSPITCTNHFVFTHDQITTDNLSIFRPYVVNKRNVYPLGTLSNFKFLLDRQHGIDTPSIHIGVEFGGNYLAVYDKKVFAFITSIVDKIRNDEIKLTLHTMYHKKTYEDLLLLFETLELTRNIDHNIRIINTAGRKSPVETAITTREAYITGSLNKNWPSPSIVITKGGEVTLEDRGEMVSIGIYGAAHEHLDVEIGAKERRTINCVDIPGASVWEKVSQELERKKEEHLLPPRQSLGVFGLLAYLDPTYFNKHILAKMVQ